MLNALFGGNKPWDNVWQSGRNRIRMYARYKRLYDGWAFRDNLSSQFQFKRLKFNPSQSIVDIGAEFLAGQSITIQISGNDDLTKLSNEIWKRSGGDEQFLESAVTASIYGDACIMLGYNDDDELCLKWMDTSVCFPVFDTKNVDQVLEFVIAYRRVQAPYPETVFFEEWKDGVVKSTEKNDNLIKIDEYDPSLFSGGPPVVWIPNLRLKGEYFGRSDLYPIEEKVQEYDHLMNKQSRAVDYYAQPNIYMKGVRKPDTLVKGEKTIYFLPSDGDMGFVEWKGAPQSVKDQIDEIRNQISEDTAVPKVAFTNFDFKNSDISGVALKVLFGPLLKKTERKRVQTWGPGIRRAMQMALRSLGHTVKLCDIHVIWGDPIPANTKEGWEIGVMQDLLGVSRKQIQRERGYSDAQIDEIETEYYEEKERDNELQVELAKSLAEAVPAPAGPGDNKSVGPGGPKKMSAKEKADHKTTTTPGKIVRATPVEGKRGAV